MPKKTPPPRKTVRQSQSEITQVVLPNDANPLGTILGGKVMHLVDIVAAIAAHRHSNSFVVTAAVDHMDFRCPIRVGEVIVLKSSVNRVFHCSMEVGVKVFREEQFTNRRRHTSSAYLTFVAIDENRKPKSAPSIFPETATEKRRYREAENRRRWRITQLRSKPARAR